MLHELMRELQIGGTTILLATHDMAEASQMATRVAILLRGRIAAIGTPMELTATGAGLTKISVSTEADCLARAEAAFPAVRQVQRQENYFIYFSTDVGPTVSALITYIQAQGDTLVDLRVERPTLEDRFLEITTKGAAR
jgi:ABC-2 type transport system ATP-binding protein